jgi:xylulokinase
VPRGELFVTGGRARSDKLVQLRADILGRPIHRVEEGELYSLGAATIAAAGAGVTIVPDLETRRFSPDPAAAARYARERAQRQEEITSLLLHGPR